MARRTSGNLREPVAASPRRNCVRMGVIGLGNMGTTHARDLLEGKIPRAELTAVCSRDVSGFAAHPSVKSYTKSEELIRSGAVDAVLIATPHFSHTAIGIDALEHGLHVLVEKPISVHKLDCERLLAAHTDERQVFAAMFNQRTDPFFKKIRQLVRDGDLGQIRRINWVVTNWFRTEAYYGGWRATWAGEGGGVLLNQCAHNLDLFQWIFGMPRHIRAFCGLGHYHDIEAEDDVTAYMEFANGATAVLITSTGEAPGSNRLEIAGESGRLVYENDELLFTRNEMEMTAFSRSSTDGFAAPKTRTVPISLSGHGGQHHEILTNFVEAVLDGSPLIAPAVEGIHSVELANAILFSSLQKKTISLPLDGYAYSRKLKQLIASSSKAPKKRRSARR